MLPRRGKECGFYLIWIFAFTVSVSVACDNEPYHNDCPNMTISVKEGDSKSLHVSGIIEDFCIWNNATLIWESACHFSHRVCLPLLTNFKENITIKGNKFELKNVSQNATGLYRLLNKSGDCVVTMRIFVLSTSPTTSSPRSGTFNIQVAKWSGVMWLCFLATFPILAIFDYL